MGEMLWEKWEPLEGTSRRAQLVKAPVQAVL